jgi:hypothetical protein
MLETSKDLLFLTLAFCALLFTIFTCVLLYQFIAIINNVRDISASVKKKLGLIDDLFKNIKNKMNSTASYIGIIANSVEKVIEYVQNKKSSPPKRNKKNEE